MDGCSRTTPLRHREIKIDRWDGGWGGAPISGLIRGIFDLQTGQRRAAPRRGVKGASFVNGWEQLVSLSTKEVIDWNVPGFLVCCLWLLQRYLHELFGMALHNQSPDAHDVLVELVGLLAQLVFPNVSYADVCSAACSPLVASFFLSFYLSYARSCAYSL
jgi:hypothetical protein